MSDIISKIIPDCSISAVDNLVNNSTTVATNIRRSRRIPKKRTFDDDWIVERSRQNGKKFKTEIDCSVNTTITYSSVNNDQTIPLSVQKCGYSSPKKEIVSLNIAKISKDFYDSDLSEFHGFQSIVPDDDNNNNSQPKININYKIDEASKDVFSSPENNIAVENPSKDENCSRSPAVSGNIMDMKTNESSTTKSSLGVERKSSERKSKSLCPSSETLEMLADICSELWERMYEFHR